MNNKKRHIKKTTHKYTHNTTKIVFYFQLTSFLSSLLPTKITPSFNSNNTTEKTPNTKQEEYVFVKKKARNYGDMVFQVFNFNFF